MKESRDTEKVIWKGSLAKGGRSDLHIGPSTASQLFNINLYSTFIHLFSDLHHGFHALVFVCLSWFSDTIPQAKSE